ncbi:hypothetical protein [Rhodococcus sp. 1139]|uniref:hypothetical protein n=1 Tax=Rhodococcus sp. 1139 TaxID=1833762 RepID=UPI00114D24E5|nr:hypothetical protein [Rhodococcus sp. 1139]
MDVDTLPESVRKLSSQIYDELDGVISVCLGGSLAYSESTRDSISDVDIFVFWEDLPQHANELSKKFANFTGMSFPIRVRAYTWEHHISIEGIDVDIKHMPRWKVREFAHQAPNLDELYLEKIHSILKYVILSESNDQPVSSLQSMLRENLEEWTEYLAAYALETYGKAVFSAVKQGLQRQEHACSVGCIEIAKSTLGVILFLQIGEWPPPFKWRMSATRSGHIENWSKFSDALKAMRTSGMSEDLQGQLRQLRRAELAVAGDYTQAPWREFAEDHWWWSRIGDSSIDYYNA